MARYVPQFYPKFPDRHLNSIRLVALPGAIPAFRPPNPKQPGNRVYSQFVTFPNRIHYHTYSTVGISYLNFPRSPGKPWVAFAVTRGTPHTVKRLYWEFCTLEEAFFFLVSQLTPYSLEAFMREAGSNV